MNGHDHDNLLKVTLKPGELYAAETPTLVSTVLGSCVSVTMFSHQLRLGAICHAVLPRDTGREPGELFRYVDRSVEAMLAHFNRYGIHADGIEVKLFGGSDMLAAQNNRLRGIGQQNIEVALQLLAKNLLTLNANDLGGTQGRKLFFKTHTGEVFLKKLRSMVSKEHGAYGHAPRKRR